ncbi:LysR family transcriptional regulator [Proteiniclasticum sp.]|uniref:LysR family transcriptional regulator n=1 Tax=Proteiniclasticum sp. TaxID=2053595 RepID=UPI0028966909|nr:LysR family transcriptional regulator [Proteiniclasticum sp.]
MIDQKLESFLSVVKNGSYTKAALELELTQPAISHHMKLLEEHYGSKLLEYRNRTLTLTEEGKIVLDHAEMLKARERVIRERLQHMTEKRKETRFGATLTIGEFTLADILPELFSSFVHEHLTLLVDNTKNMLKMLKDGEIQFALVEGLIDKDEYRARLLKTSSFVLVVKEGHRLTKMKNVRLDDLLSEVLIIREEGSGSREILERGLIERNRSLKSFSDTIVMGNVNIMKRMVETGMGISMMYRDAALAELTERRLVEVPIEDLAMEREFNFVEVSDPFSQDENDKYYTFFKDHLTE